MQLTVDIGNTMAKLVFFGENEIVAYRYLIQTTIERSYDEHASSFLLFLRNNNISSSSVTAAIVSSVVPHLTPIFLQLIKNCFGIEAKVLGPGLKTGLAIHADNPKEVGADLIGDAVGAKTRYGHSVLVADMGTANKMVVLDDKGDFIGCSIGPGLGLGLRALVDFTAALTDVSLQIPPKVIGKNTPDCMNSGLLYGAICAIEGMASKIEKEVGYPLKKVLTGGYSSYVKDALPDFSYEPDLLAIGLLHILRRQGEK